MCIDTLPTPPSNPRKLRLSPGILADRRHESTSTGRREPHYPRPIDQNAGRRVACQYRQGRSHVLKQPCPYVASMVRRRSASYSCMVNSPRSRSSRSCSRLNSEATASSTRRIRRLEKAITTATSASAATTRKNQRIPRWALTPLEDCTSAAATCAQNVLPVALFPSNHADGWPRL